MHASIRAFIKLYMQLNTNQNNIYNYRRHGLQLHI